MNYRLKDKSTATVDVKIANIDEDAMYYPYTWENDEYFMPLSQKDGVLTFSFENAIEYFIDYNSIRMGVDVYKTDSPGKPDIYNDSYIGYFNINYEILGYTAFGEDRWNGVEIDGAICDGADALRITIEGGGTTTANKDGEKYEPEDADYIEISIYNETLGTKLDAEFEIEVCEYEKEEGYIFFDTVVTSLLLQPTRAKLNTKKTFLIAIL